MELFNYLLKVSACSALFFAFYLLVLRKLTFFKINRFYLLFSVVISFIIPALQFTIEREVVEPLQTVISQPANDNQSVNQDVFQAPITVNSIQVKGTGSFNWLDVLPIVYGFIVFALLLIAIVRVVKLLKHTKAPVKEINGLKLVTKRSGFTNCSFFNYVFIDENSLSETELTVLLSHEEVHAGQYHSVDKLILMIAKAFMWFNPIIYLYDKALEQTHEYEADEITSRNVGTETYATLLLNLAVSKSSNPLIHNFVKSPIKQRIRMLFNSKSKNMKKLAYLLALPIGLVLIWGFTVKIKTRVKTLVQQETPQQQDTLMGKTVKGKVIGFEKLKMGEVLNLKVGNTIVPIINYMFKNKVKIGDEISVTLYGKTPFPPPPIGTDTANWYKEYKDRKTSYMASKVIGANGDSIYVHKVERYAFLYEANRARFAESTIKSIEKSANGTINKIVLYDKYGFTINLNVAAQQFKSNDFKKGDPIIVKFIGEKLTGAKTYKTDKMIALYSQPKKYELINKALYPKFYHENGRQKVYNWPGQQKITQDTKATYTPIKVYPKPILLTSSSINVDTKTHMLYMKDAVIKVFNGELTAKDVEMDEENGIIIAKKGKFKTERGNVTESELMTFNIKTGAFTASYPNGKAKLGSAAFELISRLNFPKSDSIRVSKVMDVGVILTGNVKMNIDNYAINARIVSATKDSNIITAYFGSLKNGNEAAIKAEMIEFDMVTKEVKYGKRP